MNAARGTVQDMLTEEGALLDRRAHKGQVARRLTGIITIAGTLVAMGFIVLAGLATSREIEVTARAQAQIQTLHAQLEWRVKERTASLSAQMEMRKSIEEALRESQDRLTGIIGSAMDAIITVDEQQRVVLFNAAAEQMFLCPAKEAVGRSIERFIP